MLTRTYDQCDRVLSYTNAQNETLQYRYDASGNLVQLIYPDSQTVSYDYDARERLVSITDWNARLTTLEWDEAGRLLKVTRPNGTYREYQYDSAGRLLQIAERKASKRAICLVRFELDAAGRPTKKLTLPLPQPASVAGFTATHNADNQITGVPYDADGNLQSTYLPLSWFPVAEMAWDTRNRLSQIWEEVWDGEAFVGYYQSQFVYDAEGHRTHQTNGGQTTRYTVNPHGLSGLSEVLIEHKPNNTQRRYLWGGPAGLLYEIQTDSSGAETNVRYYHSDQAGSTLALTDSAGEVTGRAEYTPYGVISHTSGVMDTPYLFNGAYGVQTDFQTGLIHMRARYYHPWLGRFISEDPIQFDGGNNWYAFANGDPVMKIDPTGEVVPMVVGGVIALWALGADTANAPGPGDRTYASNGMGRMLAFGTSAPIVAAAPISGGFFVGATQDMSIQMSEMSHNSGQSYSFSQTMERGAVSSAFSFAGSAIGSLATSGGRVTPMTITATYRGAAPLSGSGAPFHVVYSAGGTSSHAVGGFFRMTTQTIPSRTMAGYTGNSYGALTLPVANAPAATASGMSAWSCFTGAGSAFVRGWTNPLGAAVGVNSHLGSRK